MRTFLTSTVIALLGLFIWRNGESSINNLTLPNFPDYFSSNASECGIIISPDSTAFQNCEDALFWDHHSHESALERRMLLISCDEGRLNWNTVMGPLRDPKPHGSLWIYDISAQNSQPRRISLEGYPTAHDFHPLGMDIFPSSNSAPWSNLFVINHAADKSTVEQFKISFSDPTKAIYVRTISHRHLVSPNGMALTSPTSFFVTNDHKFTRRLFSPLGHILPVIESVLALPLGWISHIQIGNDGTIQHDFVRISNNGITNTLLPNGIAFPNGIATSPSGDQVAVASTSHGRVLIYDLDKTASHTLTYRDTISVPFSPDNLSYDDEGTLIVAGHPHFPSLISVASQSVKAAPSWIISVKKCLLNSIPDTAPISIQSRVRISKGYDMRTLYQSSGKHFSTSSTGLIDSRTGIMYGVGLYQEGLLVC